MAAVNPNNWHHNFITFKNLEMSSRSTLYSPTGSVRLRITSKINYQLKQRHYKNKKICHPVDQKKVLFGYRITDFELVALYYFIFIAL